MVKSLRNTGSSHAPRAASQVVDGAAEVRAVGEHRQARRAAGRVRLGGDRGVEIGREIALRRRTALDLGDHPDGARSGRNAAGEVAGRRRGERPGAEQVAHLGSVQHRDLVALGREDLVEHRHGPDSTASPPAHSPLTRSPRRGVRRLRHGTGNDRRRRRRAQHRRPRRPLPRPRRLPGPQGRDRARRGSRRSATHRPRLVVLDVGLPDIDGLEVCRRLRQTSQIPVIFLTARDGEVDRVLGLELGGDDYLTKPFSPAELVARVKAVLRRVDGGAAPRSCRPARSTVDSGRREVLRRRRAGRLHHQGVRPPALPRRAARARAVAPADPRRRVGLRLVRRRPHRRRAHRAGPQEAR